MPRIILVEPSGNQIFIDCNNIPMPGGGPADLIIPHAQRVAGPLYEYLLLPAGTPGPAQPNDIVIHLTNAIVPGSPTGPGNIEMPYNGGPVDTFCVRID